MQHLTSIHKEMRYYLIPVLILVLLPLTVSRAQDVPSSWSIDLMGGTNFGHFTYASEITPQGQLNIRYALSPVFSLYGNAGAGVFEYKHRDTYDIYFENEYLHYGLGMRFNLLRMLAGVNGTTERLGIYGFTGMGLIYSDVSATGMDSFGNRGQSYSGHSMLYEFGGGLSLRLSRRFDFFAQTGLNISPGDLLDGFETSEAGSGLMTQNDAFLQTSAGFTIKFGSSAVTHADWYGRDHRVDPLAAQMQETIQRIETEIDMTNTAMDSAHERLQMLQRTLEDLSHLVNSVHSEHIMSQNQEIQDLMIRVEQLESEVRSMAEQRMQEEKPEQTESFFVIAGVYRIIDNAETQFEELVDQGYDDAGIIRDRNRNYYLVVYSGHTTEREAYDKLQRIQSDVNPNAWLYRL